MPIGNRGAAGDLTEGFVKIGAVVESAGHGDAGEAGVGTADHFNGPLHPLVDDIFHRRKTVESLKQGGKVCGTDMGDGCQLGQTYLSIQVFVDILQHGVKLNNITFMQWFDPLEVSI